MIKKVLFISPYFPPHRAIGTKRAINFVQGVHEQEDWEVIVLASKPLNEDKDPDLLVQIPSGVVVDYGFVGILRPLIRLLSGGNKKEKKKDRKPIVKPSKSIKKSQSKGSITPFDQYLWDVRSAIKNGKSLIIKHKPDVIWVNADPWSGFLVAHRLSKTFGIPWIADLRDPWSIFEKKMELRPKLTANIIRKYERKFVSSASRVVLNTQTASEAYKSSYPEEPASKFTFIRNAFNERLLPTIDTLTTPEAFVFGYYGSFRTFVPSKYLLRGFAGFILKRSLSPHEVKIQIRGNVYSEFWEQVSEYQLESYIEVESEVTLDQTVTLLRSWDVLLLSAVNDFRWMINAKFYDYLYARKPILAVSDNPELNKLIEDTQSGSWVNTCDQERVVELFEHYFEEGKKELLFNENLIQSFGLKKQAELFRSCLKDALDSKHS